MKRNIFLPFICALLLSFAPFAAIPAQTTANVSEKSADGAAARVETISLESKLIGRTMSYRVVLPREYDAKGFETARFPVLYLLHGLTGHYNDWTDRTKLAQYAAAYRLIIVTPEGENGWYVDSATAPNEKYETYFLKELFPDVESRFRTLNERENRAIAGLSMGGYGALKFGLKYPEKFVFAGSMSGALRAASWNEENLQMIGKWILQPIVRAFGASDSPMRRENDIYQIIKDAPAEKIGKLPFLYVDCGTEDFLIANSKEMAELLQSRKIPHEFRQLPGSHNWAYWDAQVQEILRVSTKFLRQN